MYCENIEEVYNSLENILEENNWGDKKVFLLNDNLKDLFKGFELKDTKKTSESTYFFTTCEYLISNDGSLLISSNQIAEKKQTTIPSKQPASPVSPQRSIRPWSTSTTPEKAIALPKTKVKSMEAVQKIYIYCY